MKITFLGTGTSQGVPIIGCGCPVCSSPNPKDKRLRSSLWIQTESTDIVIDTGPDFRYQMLRAKVPKLDAVVFTHGHKDHVAGLDDVRAFNYWQKAPIDVYASLPTRQHLKKEFEYVFEGPPYPGIPQINLHTVHNNEPFTIGDVTLIPVRVLHYKMEVFGYRIGDFTYITDANFIDADELEKIKNSKILVLNALRHQPHISHFTLNEALEVAKVSGAEQTYLTHISHQLGLCDEIESALPPTVHLAYDGLMLTL